MGRTELAALLRREAERWPDRAATLRRAAVVVEEMDTATATALVPRWPMLRVIDGGVTGVTSRPVRCGPRPTLYIVDDAGRA